MPPSTPPTPETAQGAAALGGLSVDLDRAARIARSVGGVTAAAGDFQDGLELDDSVVGAVLIRASIADGAR
ncbi:hypothetical protein ACFSCV_18210 [Methylopila henanensis]|uniref:Uncharacterized protein n=1 Tax=Methylopila henanensis TaxID=873516 RepID=A0ABW4K9T1_9HYPH